MEISVCLAHCNVINIISYSEFPGMRVNLIMVFLSSWDKTFELLHFSSFILIYCLIVYLISPWSTETAKNQHKLNKNKRYEFRTFLLLSHVAAVACVWCVCVCVWCVCCVCVCVCVCVWCVCVDMPP